MKYAQLSSQSPKLFGVPKPRSRAKSLSINPGVWIIPFAAAGSLAMLPTDPSEPGSLVLSAWLLALGLLGTIGLDVAGHGFDRVFRAENILMVATIIVVFPELLQPYYGTMLDLEIVRLTFLSIGVFGTSVAIGSSFGVPELPGKIVDLAKRQYSDRLLFRILVTCWALGMFNFAFTSGFSLSTMIYGLRTNRWDAPWARGQMGGWDAFGDFLTNFGNLVPLFTILLALRLKSWSQSRVILGIACSVMCIAFIAQGGGRRTLVVIIGSCMLTWVFVKRKQLRPKHFIVLMAVLIVTGVAAELMLQYRTVGFGNVLESNDEVEVTGLHVDNNFYSLGETLRLIPSEVNFVGFQHVVYVLVRPIPRVFWPGKPTSSGFDLARATGQQGLSISITMIGELYMSFGWTGIVVGGIVIGWIAKWWSQLAVRDYGLSGSAFYALGAMALFLGMRSLLELVLMTYPILCWYGLDRLLWRWTMKNRFQTSSRLQPLGMGAR